MADNTLYILANIRDYFRGCQDNATGSSRERYEPYIKAVESAMKRYNSTRYVPVTRCCECQHWEPENAEEGDHSGHCRKQYGMSEGNVTDGTWFCSDGEKVEE